MEVGEKRAAVDMTWWPSTASRSPTSPRACVRCSVISSVERMTGLQVTEVTVSVNDVHIPLRGRRTRGTGAPALEQLWLFIVAPLAGQHRRRCLQGALRQARPLRS